MKKIVIAFVVLLITFKGNAQKDFEGMIRYHMMGNDVSHKDSMFIIFGTNKIRVDIYLPPDEKAVELTTMIINFADSTLLMVDHDIKKYFVQPLSSYSQAVFNLVDNHKIGLIAGEICEEYKGDVKNPDGQVFEAATLICKDYPYTAISNFNFLGLQPVVADGKIVLAYRTRLVKENENTYIMAYSIERGNTDHWFDLKDYEKL